MEWKLQRPILAVRGGRRLETFLSGMETGCPVCGEEILFSTLKPSLVEWKQDRFVKQMDLAISLETFLSGMET